MLQSQSEETEGKLQMLLSPRKKGLTSLLKEVRVFKATRKFTNSDNAGDVATGIAG